MNSTEVFGLDLDLCVHYLPKNTFFFSLTITIIRDLMSATQDSMSCNISQQITEIKSHRS